MINDIKKRKIYSEKLRSITKNSKPIDQHNEMSKSQKEKFFPTK